MPIPDYQTVMLPLLEYYSDGKTHPIGDAVDLLGRQFALSEDELRELLPSGRQEKFRNRVAWAKTYLVKAGLLSSPKRGHFAITPAGQSTLRENPARIDVAFLRRFPSFVSFVETKNPSDATSEPVPAPMESPEEMIEAAHARLNQDLASDLLGRIKAARPVFFEGLVVELLLKMGYGGSRHDAGRAIGRSGDGGIDGIINEDRLGLDSIYLQAKRWDQPVGRPEIQKFAGALAEHRARKGVFITTSTFTKEAVSSATKHDARIVLIDGEKLATLMIEHGLGVTLQASYDVKRIDSDYFTEE
jgi:restriction system protein